MFHIDWDHIDAPCPVCNRVHRAYHTFEEMAYDAVALAIRDAGIIERDDARDVLIRRVEDGDAPFVQHELEAALVLAEAALATIPGVEDILIPVIERATTPDEIYEAIAIAETYWRQNSFTQDAQDRWDAVIAAAVALGVFLATDVPAVDTYFRQRLIDGMRRSAQFYHSEFFSRRVVPALYKSIEDTLTGVDPFAGPKGFAAVRDVLNARLKDVPYWNVVGNAAASRAYHYGLVRGGYETGAQVVRFVAVIDKRTSEICRNMNGMEWPIGMAVDILERIAGAPDPEEVKNIAPWVKADAVKGKSAGELYDMGVVVPPLHGRCRSQLVIA